MSTKVHNLIILDESGSMQSIKREAIDSVNETFQTIRAAKEKNPDQEHTVTFVSFNSNKIKTIYDCVPADGIKEINGKVYCPDCCTPLYDAMGKSINALRKKVESEDKVLVTVITDGYENASKEYSGQAIKALVEELKKDGWVFAYIGAEHDVEAAAAQMAINNTLRFGRNGDSVGRMSMKLKESRDVLYCKFSCKDFGKEDYDKNFFDTDSVD